MFNFYNFERLSAWRQFRDSLETSQSPLEDVANFWAQAPFVSKYLNPNSPESWPDPWKLIIDGKFDDLAICLGMLYTLKLTERFKDSLCEIFRVVENNNTRYILVINNSILNLEYRSVRRLDDLVNMNPTLVWSKLDRL